MVNPVAKNYSYAEEAQFYKANMNPKLSMIVMSYLRKNEDESDLEEIKSLQILMEWTKFEEDQEARVDFNRILLAAKNRFQCSLISVLKLQKPELKTVTFTDFIYYLDKTIVEYTKNNMLMGNMELYTLLDEASHYFNDKKVVATPIWDTLPFFSAVKPAEIQNCRVQVFCVEKRTRNLFSCLFRSKR